MKVLLYSDVHISQDSSIVRGFKGKYSTRLWYLIKSLDWAEKLADDEKCNSIFLLGDTFDKPIINAMEATAIQDIKWSNLPHYAIVGNHDSNVASLEYSSVKVLEKLGFNIISQPTNIKAGERYIDLIPYTNEDNRKPLKDYLKENDDIVMSHNDIAGFNFGQFLSKEGFKMDEIEGECALYLNGHLHNSSWLSKKILNVGNLCGQNFGEDAFKYKHGCWILDTDTLKIEFYENPYALNFYKLLVDDKHPISSYKLKPNAVLMIKCLRECIDECKRELEGKDIVAYRILIFDKDIAQENKQEIHLSNNVDYINQFCDFIKSQLGNSNIVNEELSEICSKGE